LSTSLSENPLASGITASLGKTDPAKLLGQFFRSFRRPHLSDSLHHYHGINQLARRWPTFPFLQFRRIEGLIKTIPLHLGPYLDRCTIGDPDSITDKILKASDCQEEEQKAIDSVLKALDSGSEPKVADHPLAMAMACHLFRGGKWLRSNRAKAREIVLQSATASYIALCSGVFADEITALTERIATEPKLVVDLAQSRMFRKQLRESWFQKALISQPLYNAHWLFITNQEKAAFKLLRKSAQTDPITAGICAGLEPEHDDAKKWMKIAMQSNEALYWAGRLWRGANDDIAKVTHVPAAVAQLVTDPKWYYHWTRDIEWDEIGVKVATIWPDPWAVECVVDRRLAKDLVSELYAKREFNHQDSLESAVILWAADYVAP